MLFRNKIQLKMDAIKDGSDGSSGQPQATPTQTPAQNTKALEGEGDGSDTDDFGYPLEAATEDKPADQKPDDKKDPKDAKAPEKGEPEKVAPVSGYGEKPPAAPAPEDVKPPVKEEKIDLGFEVEHKQLVDEDAKRIKEFAKKHKLSKEATQDMVNDRVAELKQMKAADEQADREFKAEVQKQRLAWDKELREDPTFGGENFAHNIHRVDKVLNDFMPETKKVLTERGSMLPPYVMRDLSKFADHLYKTDSLDQGQPAAAKTDDEDDALSYYE